MWKYYNMDMQSYTHTTTTTTCSPTVLRVLYVCVCQCVPYWISSSFCAYVSLPSLSRCSYCFMFASFWYCRFSSSASYFWYSYNANTTSVSGQMIQMSLSFVPYALLFLYDTLFNLILFPFNHGSAFSLMQLWVARHLTIIHFYFGLKSNIPPQNLLYNVPY